MSEEKYEVNVRPEKVTVVEEMKEKLGYQGVVLVTFNRLDVKNATLLRRKFLAHGVEYKVIKNTLPRIAANDLGITGLDDLASGHERSCSLQGRSGSTGSSTERIPG